MVSKTGVAQSAFGAVLRRRRLAAGLTQEELAERSGLTARTISNLERGRTGRPYQVSAESLARALELPEAEASHFIDAARGRGARNGMDSHRGGAHGGFLPAASSPAAGGPGHLVPHQLPIVPAHFIGRDAELTVLSGLLDQAPDAGDPVVIAAIGGSAGVGKTALALHWAHRVAERFPDGQLYADLRGFDSSGAHAEPGEAIRSFLDALGVGAERVPARLDAQAALYRSLLVGKRVLVVLDNARDAGQVRPLLPGSPLCFTVVTSRDQLAGLSAAEGAHLLMLNVLRMEEAQKLLARRLGAARAAAQPEAIREIARLCAGLPLALSIAAARLNTRPAFALSAVAAELRNAESRLDALDAGDAKVNVRAVFSWSYRLLSPPAARMFRLIGLHPGPDITAPAAASLAGIPGEQARAALGELAHAFLLAEHVPGRFACHDLLRAYGAEQARGTDGNRECRAAVRRMLDHYLHTGNAAARLLQPADDTVTSPEPLAAVTPKDIRSYPQAMAWFEAEHQVLMAAIVEAGEAQLDAYAWQLAWCLAPFFLVAADNQAAPYARRRAFAILSGLDHPGAALVRKAAVEQHVLLTERQPLKPRDRGSSPWPRTRTD